MAIQSVSAWPEKRGEIRRMLEVAAADIKQLGGSVELADIGKQKVRGRHLGVTEPWGAGLPEGLVGLSTFLSHLASGNLLVFRTNGKGPIWVLNCVIPSVGLGQSFCNTRHFSPGGRAVEVT